MSSYDSLCNLPPPPPRGCCDPAPQAPAAPITPFNSPGLSAIEYRIGTFTSFRRAMLDAVPRAPAPNPFANWRAGSDGDYHTLLIELWAYLADILTFYQERLANESYLPTATQRDSLRRLAELIDYRPNPGAGASALVAFTVAQNKIVSIPASFRAGTRAAPGKPAAVFETEAALTARGEHSAISLSAVAPTNQFAQLTDYGSLFSGLRIAQPLLASIAANLYGSAGASYLQTLTYTPTIAASASIVSAAASSLASSATVPASAAISAGVTISSLFVPTISDFFIYRPFVNTTTRTIVLQGTNTRLANGDYVLVVERERASGEKATPRQLTQVIPNKAANTTTISWRETSGTSYNNSNNDIKLYALRTQAGAFGNSAPAWNSLPATLTNSDNKNPNAPYKDQKWDDSANAAFNLPAGATILLDSTYDNAQGTPDAPGWAVLLPDDATKTKAVHITDARPVSATGYAISAKVTRLTLRGSDTIPASTFPLRSTVILTGAEELKLQNNLPLPEPLSGRTLVLSGLYPQLQTGQMVIVQGNVYDSTTTPPSQVVNAEVGVLDGPPALDAANNLTTVTLKHALAKQYARAGATLLANVVEATQGETVRDEVLGSGDGSAFQLYRLKKAPLTYLPSTDPEGVSAVESMLLVTVNGVRWAEQRALIDSSPDAQDYTTKQDDAGQTAVVFGDGMFGARPPTGRDNIRARYRKGLGASGNVVVGAIQQLIDSVPGLQKVTNPQPSIGGADRESSAKIRANAPNSVRTFGRAVSVADYAALALSYPGVAKAGAAWVLRDPLTLRAIPQPYIQLTIATADQLPLAQQTSFARKLRSFLDQRRDPNVPLRVGDVTPVYIDVAATIDVDDRFGRQATLNAALRALNPGLNADGTPGYFAFERLQFGESIHLSGVYRALQTVPGVRDATITTLRRLDLNRDPAIVRDDIFVRPTEIAVIKNDPADTANQFGKLTITLGEGGFVDT